ncbi:hypothetical protein K788_0007669 [Paraburkholderia caribensis MBA4]|uniref:Uncharacterized protein n=1 Tax=Paraburkholderia caribensis MBA4 TaxID=1323664 RepID=A0A0N7JUX0_9BURK|nr:hypothetical protein [Paraburkholderia caribensis]ALL67589.1 hypothetical protein K788_0007669 [Paraburkholderia caribensis MBA4]
MIDEKDAFWSAGTQMSIKDLSNFAVGREVGHTGGVRATTRLLPGVSRYFRR